MSNNFSSKKKSENFRPNFFWDQKFSIFDRKIFRRKSQWKIKNFKFRKFFEKKTKFENFDFHWFFQRKIFRSKIGFFWSQKKFGQKFSDFFFDENFFDKFFSDHLFRSQMISRFRKSHLEQRASIIKIRTARTKKNVLFFSSIFRLAALRFVNLLYRSVPA